ncbi:MAG: hypothetical protein ACREDR_46340, partial [Blastocatellia bacterium]
TKRSRPPSPMEGADIGRNRVGWSFLNILTPFWEEIRVSHRHVNMYGSGWGSALPLGLEFAWSAGRSRLKSVGNNF